MALPPLSEDRGFRAYFSMKTLLLKDSTLRVSVMSFRHEIVYSVMRAYFEAIVSQVLIWDERSYGLLWNTVMVDDISARLHEFQQEGKRWRLYAVLFGVINLRRELRIVPFENALEEHMTTGLTVSAVAVIDMDRIEDTFGTRHLREDVLEDFVNKYNAWHNSFDWFVRLFENGRLKAENRVGRTMDDVIMWLKHQPELVNVRITPNQFADARTDVETDFGILIRKSFMLTGVNGVSRMQFREGAMALRAAFDDLIDVHGSLHDPESIGSVFWSADSVVALLSNGIGFSIKRGDLGFVRINAPVGTPLHIVRGLRNMLTAFASAAPEQLVVTESEDISVPSFITGDGFVPSLSECHRQLCEAIGRMK